MAKLDPSKVLLWTLENLERWLNQPGLGENDQFELKSELLLLHKKVEPEIRENKNQEIRKDFSAFANSLGGFIFVGIRNTKEIVGVIEDGEYFTELNKVLSNSQLLPKLQLSHMNQHVIPISSKGGKTRVVYVFYMYCPT